MRSLLLLVALLAPVSPLLVGSAEAADFTKQEAKDFEAAVKAAYPGTGPAVVGVATTSKGGVSLD